MMPSLNWDFTQNNDKIALRLSGELSRNTLLPLWQQRDFLCQKKAKSIAFDLAEVSRLDSAGFALLCELLHEAQQYYEQVHLANPPQQLLTLADLVNLSHFIATFTN